MHVLLCGEGRNQVCHIKARINVQVFSFKKMLPAVSTNLPSNNGGGDVIYEQCGGIKVTCKIHLLNYFYLDPSSSAVTDLRTKTDSLTAVVYDNPELVPPPLLRTQPCMAYSTTQPVKTQHCVAYIQHMPAVQLPQTTPTTPTHP